MCMFCRTTGHEMHTVRAVVGCTYTLNRRERHDASRGDARGGAVKPYYKHGGVTIYHGDCLDVLPSLKAECIITSPPYNCRMDYEGHDDAMSVPAYLSWLEDRTTLWRTR